MTYTPAGWYADPENAGQTRWWDGNQWTDHRAPAQPVQAADAQPYSVDTPLGELKAPDNTEVYTPWIWLIIVLPMLPSLGLLTVDWAGMFDFSDPTGMSSFALFTQPGYLIAAILGWPIYGVCAWFAYLDWRELGRRGVPRPFHFAWVFLSQIVYAIGRSVVVRRRTGRGIAPMWAAIASAVLSFGIVVYMMVAMFAAVFAQMDQMPSGTFS